MKYISQIIIILVFGALCACIEPFDPNIIDADEHLLVVDGRITDQPGPYTVTISNSATLGGDPLGVSVNEIYIEDDEGTIETLLETSKGIYQTTSLQGQVNRSYRLNFVYNGNQIQSSWAKIHKSAEIDSIHYQIDRQGTTDEDIENVGVQFLLDNHSVDGEPSYYRFERDETWRTTVKDYLEYDLLGFHEVRPTSHNLPTICWKNKSSKDINLATTQGLSKNKLVSHKLGLMLGNDGEERFTVRYSLLVKQFTIDENEYTFWKNIKESNDDIGKLFDKQPAQVFGNLINLSNPGKDVLGYFSASGLTEKRIYVNSFELKDPSFFITCPPYRSINSADYEFGFEYQDAVVAALSTGSYYFKELIHSVAGDVNSSVSGVNIVRDVCVDCTRKGGVLNKPEFWIDQND